MDLVSLHGAQVANLDQTPPPQLGFGRVIGVSESLQRVVRQAQRLTRVDTAVLLQGETGVGKEVFARAIHDSGDRRRGPFVALNCGGLPRELLASELFGYSDGAFTGARRGGMAGKLEAAHGGTLFLDEIAEMPLDLQPYLLRVLEGGEVCPLGSGRARKVEFRLLAACNRDLRSEAAAGRFRSDLYYRVSVTSLHIPPLRERVDDIPALIEHFMREVLDRYGLGYKRLAPEVLETLLRYSYPGNVRELRNLVESLVVLNDGDSELLRMLPEGLTAGEPATVRSHPARPAGAVDWRAGLEQLECTAIDDALRRHGGNLTRAAHQLQIARSTLYLKLKKYGLESTLNELRFAAASLS
ncbi:MAG: hypothetical protein JWN48_4340 [Myxococcaceae bacterium]|nr:hypothetical protein [Myxococcaceae bacterium]